MFIEKHPIAKIINKTDNNNNLKYFMFTSLLNIDKELNFKHEKTPRNISFLALFIVSENHGFDPWFKRG